MPVVILVKFAIVIANKEDSEQDNIMEVVNKKLILLLVKRVINIVFVRTNKLTKIVNNFSFVDPMLLKNIYFKFITKDTNVLGYSVTTKLLTKGKLNNIFLFVVRILKLKSSKDS